MDVTQANLEQTIDMLTLQAVEAARDRYSVTLDFSMNSLVKFNTLVDQARQIYLTTSVSEQGLQRTVDVWGAYLGETMRRNKRGVWKLDPEQTGDRHVYLTTQNVRLYPFEQVRQKITGQEAVIPERDMPPPPTEPEKKNLNPLIILLIAIITLTVLGIIASQVLLFIQKSRNETVARQRADYEAQFLPNMDAYMKEYPNPAGHDPILHGKVLIVNKNTGRVADLQYQLPENLKAANPQEIGVIAQKDCAVVEAGVEAGTENKLYQLSCQMTLVDFTQKEAGYQQNFISSKFRDGIRLDKNGIPMDDPGGGLDPVLIDVWLDKMIE
jgi:hypothetical protein